MRRWVEKAPVGAGPWHATTWWFFCFVVCGLVGCQGLLGIEERTLDTEELSERGYRGCEPGRGLCDACTSEWHECICDGWQTLPEAQLRLQCARDHAPASIRERVIAEAEEQYERYQSELGDGGATDSTDETAITDETDDGSDTVLPSFCRDPGGNDECMSCFCDHCGEELAACEQDEDCSAIFECVGQYDCDPFPVTGPFSCYQPEFCGPTIDAAGGIEGQSHARFREALDCNVVNACPCGDEASQCWPEAGCECENCWESCLCEGLSDAVCIERCSNADCGSNGTCDCNDCVDDCLCKGDRDLFYCMELCRDGDSCTPQRGCVCGDCVSDCTCFGDSPSQCRQWCEPCSPDEGCSCGGDCYSSCYCEGNSVEVCDARCGTGPCSVNGGCNCSDCYGDCLCMGFSPSYCDNECRVDSCTWEGGCFCGNCYDDCLCQGNTTTYCNDTCYPPPCSPANGCTCDSCEEACVCNGNGAAYCADFCAPPPCSQEGGCNCGDCYSDCLCSGSSPSYCNDTCYPDSCTLAGGCVCGDCRMDCLCAGGTATDCDTMCGACNPAAGCVCGSCYDDCLCTGNGSSYCNDLCYPTGCTYAGGCNCGSCQADCECMGYDTITCETQCNPGSFPDCADYDACGGCFTCAGSCACGNPAGGFASCIDDCGVSGCTAGDCDTCQSCQARCECEGGDPEVCRDDCTGLQTCTDFALDACEECACDNCVSEWRICDETPGCRELLSCMAEFECSNIRDCYEPALCEFEIDGLGGLSSPAMQVAESLQLCRVESGCPCYRSVLEQSISCGTNTCDAYIFDDYTPVAPACCTGSAGEECGLDTEQLLGYPAGCQPLGQPGTVTTDCNSTYPPGAPYYGAELAGCCRPDGFCGFHESQLGLGCVEGAVFGTPTTTPCTVGAGGAGGASGAGGDSGTGGAPP